VRPATYSILYIFTTLFFATINAHREKYMGTIGFFSFLHFVKTKSDSIVQSQNHQMTRDAKEKIIRSESIQIEFIINVKKMLKSFYRKL